MGKSLRDKLKEYQSQRLLSSHIGRITSEGVMSRRDRFMSLWGGLKTEGGASQNKFEKVKTGDLEKLSIVDLAIKMVKSDPLLDMTVAYYCTLVSLEHTLTAESDVAQRAIDEINEMLEFKKIPLSLLVSHIASSTIVRGNVCVERVFDEKHRPSSIYSVDPRWFEWKLMDAGVDGQRWFLGQYTGEHNTWEKLAETPNVLWLSVNPLIGERAGRSPLATAFDPLIKDTELLNDLSEVVRTQAFVRRFIQYQTLKMKELGYSETAIDQMTKDAAKDMTKWANLGPEEIPTSSDVVQWNQESGATGRGGLSFVDVVDRVYDRKSLRGAEMPAALAGSSEFATETSIQTQGKFYSVNLGSGQERLAYMVEWGYRGFLRAMGIRGDPILSTKRVNALERIEEAKAFEAMMQGIERAVNAGIPLPTAIKMYEAESGQTFPADVIDEIKEEWERRKDMEMSGDNDGQDDSVDTSGEN